MNESERKKEIYNKIEILRKEKVQIEKEYNEKRQKIERELKALKKSKFVDFLKSKIEENEKEYVALLYI